MNQRKLLLQLLPGFIPLFVYIIADEVWGTKIGLLVAIAIGIIELAYYWIKDKKFDRFVLFDTLLIVILGIVSIVLDNDAFFKIKPALMGILLCSVLGVSAFTPNNLILNMSKNYLKGVEFNDLQYRQMKKNLRVLFWLFLGYTALVFYSVWFMSNAAWAFISGGLFYIIFGVYMAYEFIKAKIIQAKFKSNEKHL